ncbi:MAG TPA: sugar ABC transporter permease, partial [Chloroflexota bacterium]|nr:sugar ABC transporter permease [Chloroflexota bacterium]
LGPAVWAVYISFTNMALTGAAAAAPQWIGTDNFSQILHDQAFFRALRISLTYLVGSALIGQAVLGMLLALLMKGRHPLFKSVLGGLIVACWVIPDVVAGFLWFAFLHSDNGLGTGNGLFNAILSGFGLPQHAWLQEYPMAAIIVANTWRGTAFSMLLYASALEGIAPELLEAASIDGANLWGRIRLIVLPLLKGAIATDLLLITLATLSDFTLVYVLTGGGPGFDTQLLTIYTYQRAFSFYQIGYGTAISLLIIVVGAILSLLYIRVLRVDV